MIEEWYGINFPFSGGIQNVLSRQIGTRLIKNDITQLIYTNPGERVYRPDYGIGIRMFLFDDITSHTLGTLKDRIVEQMALYESRVTIDQLDVTSDNDKHTVNILMVCYLTQQPDEIFDMNLSLPIFAEQ